MALACTGSWSSNSTLSLPTAYLLQEVGGLCHTRPSATFCLQAQEHTASTAPTQQSPAPMWGLLWLLPGWEELWALWPGTTSALQCCLSE